MRDLLWIRCTRVVEQIHNKSHSLSLHSVLYRRHLSPLIPHKICLVIKPNKSAVSPVRSGSLPAGCHGNLPVLNLLSASVTKNQHFRPCRKNYMRWIEKCLTAFRIVTTFSIGMQSLGRSNYARRL